jgi:hypothetical protein
LPLFITNDGYTQENQTISKQINSCLKYETTDLYVATARIGSVIWGSIVQANLETTNNGSQEKMLSKFGSVEKFCTSINFR